jgi:hypothetical protein
MAKGNLPNDVSSGIPNVQNLTSEQTEYNRLFNSLTRTQSGEGTFSASPSSGLSYTTNSYPSDTDVFNKGEEGLMNMFAKYILIDYNLTGNDIQSLIDNTRNNSKGIATNSAVIDELLVDASISTKLAPTSGKFYDYPGASGQLSQGEIDFGKTFAGVITTGTNTVIMTALQNAKDGTTPSLLSDCFVVGDEVTLQDDSIKETFKVTNVDDGTATLTLNANIVGTFAGGANVYRSNIITDGNVFKFGGFSAEETIDVTTPEQVVASAYDTSGNGGRKTCKVGEDEIAIVKDGSGVMYVYKRDTWTEVAHSTQSSVEDMSIVHKSGTLVEIIWTTNSPAARTWSFTLDVSTTGQGAIGFADIQIGPNETTMGKCSLAIDENNPLKLKASWDSVNSSYPNSTNLRYSESNDGGDTWDTPTQVTTTNLTGADYTQPSIVIGGDGYPHIAHKFQRDTSTINRIGCANFDGASWNVPIIYTGTPHIQTNPSADVLSDGTIIVAWHGNDATDTNNNIRFSQSVDNGVTWSAMEKLTSGNINYKNFPSITRDINDIIYIYFNNRDTVSSNYKVNSLIGNSGSFVESEVYEDTSSSITNDNYRPMPSTCNNYRNFTNALTIWKKLISDPSVLFYGKWTKGVEIDITDIDIRMNITPLNDVSDIGAYMNISNNVLAVDAEVSIVDSAVAENYTDLVDTRYTIDATNDEVASLLNTTVTAEEKVTLKYNLTRTLTTDVIELTSILGGVA